MAQNPEFDRSDQKPSPTNEAGGPSDEVPATSISPKKRLLCLVPFCKRTLKPAHESHTEGICSLHWRLTDKRLRRLLFRCRRIGRPGLEAYFWDKLKIQAIERAGGIS